MLWSDGGSALSVEPGALFHVNVLFLKLGATGDVVRTTPLLRRFSGEVSWATAEKNLPLLQNLSREVRAVTWENRHQIADRRYDLVINLEDDKGTSAFLSELKFDRIYGAHLNEECELVYSDDSRPWFDLSLISRFGRAEADRLKLRNRGTYQALIFHGLEFAFAGEEYFLPRVRPSALNGDIAISTSAGEVWPMKKWAYYEHLKHKLEAVGLTVNFLPVRPTLLDHLADVQGHRCLVSGDSLPMHLALGSGVKCVSIFTCTSPWEIYEYGLQRKIVSSLLTKFFYKRGFEMEATTAITVEEVFDAVMMQLDSVVETQIV